MVIQVSTLISSAVSEDDGAAVFAALTQQLQSQEVVVVSFAGLKTASTSFVNTAFVPLLELMSFAQIKQRIKIVESTRQINHMIKWRLESLMNSVAAAE